MKLGSLFGTTKTLAKVPKPAPTEAVKAKLTDIMQLKKPGEFNIKWPHVAPQQVKDYKAITTLNELEAYCKRCIESGRYGFDYETAPSEEERRRYAEEVQRMETGFVESWPEINGEILSQDEPAEYTKMMKDLRETYLKSPLDPWKGDICTCSLAAYPHEARAIFISHKKGTRIFEPERSRTEARKLAMDMIDRMLFRNRMTVKVAWNLGFETKYSAKYAKYIMAPVSDPQVSSVRCMQVVLPQKIADPKKPVSGKGLKPQTKELFGVQMGSFTGLLKKHGVDFFDEISADEPDALVYSCEDSDYALQHDLYWLEVAKQIPKYEEWLTTIEMPFQRVIGLMEYWGMAWDENLARVKGEEAVTMQEQAAERIKKLAKDTFGIEVNPGKSGKTNEVKSLIFDYFKINPAKWSKKTGEVSLDEEAIIDMRFMLQNKLEDLKEEKYLDVPLPEDWEKRDPDTDKHLSKEERQAIRIKRRDPHPHLEAALKLLDELQNIQTYSTLLSSHIKGREKYLNEVSGRIHANYTPWTETARLNSSSPNGQNVPRLDNDVFKIRNFYVAKPGKILYFIDASGFELRLMAWKSGDEVMIEIFSTPGGDIHTRTAVELTGKAAKDITKKERQDAKPGNFGISYGGTEHALQKTFKTDYLIRKTLGQCLVIVNAIKSAYKRIPEYQRSIALDAREKGWVQTIYGYIRLLPNINSSNSYERGKDERRAGNTPIQGSAADVMKRVQNAVYEEIGRGTALHFDAEEEGITAAELAIKRGEEAPIMAHGHTDMIAQIHDEIILEMDDEPNVVEPAGAWIKAEMEKPPLPDFPVPIEAEASVGYRWGEKKSVAAWLASKRTA